MLLVQIFFNKLIVEKILKIPPKQDSDSLPCQQRKLNNLLQNIQT